MAAGYFVYLLASGKLGTLYTGVTNDLLRRTAEHRDHLVPGFTSKHDVTHLVWFEPHASIEAAILREKQIKRWRRDWKISLIEAQNPHWSDLFQSLGP